MRLMIQFMYSLLPLSLNDELFPLCSLSFFKNKPSVSGHLMRELTFWHASEYFFLMATSAELLEGLHCTVPTTCKSPYTCLHPSQKNFTTKSIYKFAKFYLAWENSQHFATVVRGVGGGGLLITGFPRKWHLRNECRNSEINSILMIDASLPRSG